MFIANQRVSRTVNVYRATCIVADIKNRTFDEFGSVEFIATNATDTVARAAFKDSGIVVPRGAQIDIECIAEQTYSIELAQFMSYANAIQA